jgi:hypothetical protein
MILPVDVSTEAESSPVQFIEMNIPQVIEVSTSYPPSTRDGLIQYFEEISEEKPSRQRRKPLKEDGLPRGNWFAFARARSIGFGLLGVLPKESAWQASSDLPLQTNPSECTTLPKKRTAIFEVDSPAMKLA